MFSVRVRVAPVVVFVFVIAACASFVRVARADEAAIGAKLKDYFAAADNTKRAALVKEIEADPAFDRARLSQWLHSAVTFEKLETGRREISVSIDNNQSRNVTLRIPKNYDPAKAWPLIYALHGTGGDGASIIQYVESLLGPGIEQYVVAAPTGYGQNVIDQDGPASREHTLVLRAIRKRVNIDANRQFVTGYSLGGHTAWTLAILNADEFAAALPMAGSVQLAETEEFWPDFIENIANLHIVCCWGERDTSDGAGGASAAGGIAGLNRKLTKLAQGKGYSMIGHELAGVDHGGVVPPAALLDHALEKVRAQYPRKIRHTFRRITTARAYWLEARVWDGPEWTSEAMKLTLQPGEDPRKAMHREIRTRLGRLEGSIDGNTIKVSRKHADDIVVWLGDPAVMGWKRDEPIVLNVAGKKVFDEIVTPDLGVCLAEAARTYDFDRLRWAGLRYVGGKKVKAVAPSEVAGMP